ncbi:MAG: MerR family transcriptional regulator [Gammaproteobacteria bacterium]|nr:MerR family transcriptional regulator [Gammaproteobacteria bacterium]
MSELRIGEAATQLGISVDTLRYYEKEGLITRVKRNVSGIRYYNDKALSQVRFVLRAQKMGFSLKEIAALQIMRTDPRKAKNDIRLLTQSKLTEVTLRLQEMEYLQRELQLLINLCTQESEQCGILESLENDLIKQDFNPTKRP